MGTIPRATRGRFFLNLDGAACGFLKSVEGGGIRAGVISEPSGPGEVAKKHIGPPQCEELAAELGFALPKPVVEWIRASWRFESPRKDGSVVALDPLGVARSERQFSQALLTEVTFPKLDGSSKDAAYLRIKFAPESIRSVKAGAKAPSAQPAGKFALASNFRLELDGVDCSKVSAIDSFTVKQTLATADVGERREPRREPGALEFPNLRITLAESGAQTWIDWFEDFVVKGNNDDSREKKGSIVLLAPDLTELARVSLRNVGIFALSPAPAVGDQIARVAAELYCEQMEL